MPDVEVVLIPAHLNGRPLTDKTVIVFDVLRATTTMLSAFVSGIRSVRVFADLAEAKTAAATHTPRPILCGEVNARPAPGVDLGNSPGQFTAADAGREIFMATTNGTKAITAASSAANLFVAALVNAKSAAAAAAATNLPILLLGSGTNEQISMEDAIGCGAVCNFLESHGYLPTSDAARIALHLFHAAADQLPTVLRDCQGGRNIIRAGLEPDIDFAARLNIFDIVGAVDTRDLVVWPK